MACYICECRETVDSVIRLQIAAETDPQGTPFVPLCRRHLTEAEGALDEVKRLQSAPVVIKCSGVRMGGAGGG